MSKEVKYTQDEAHKRFAVDLFNHVWTLLEKEKRSREDEDRMVHAAHASRFHWEEIGTEVNLARGEWQVSRVYSVLQRPPQAIYHAKRCLEICRENNIGDWDLAFAYEALARAYSVAGDEAETEKYIELATKAGDQIREKEDRDLLFDDLATIPGYEGR